MRDVQREQRGRLREVPPKKSSNDMVVLPSESGGSATLSVTDEGQWSRGDGKALLEVWPSPWSKLLNF
jgi:hypothetical protein